MIEAINIVLALCVLGLSAALARVMYQRGIQVGWRDCMRMVTEAAEEHAEREVQEQRSMVQHWKELVAQEEAAERNAAEVARWN